MKLRTYQPDFEKRLKNDCVILDEISEQYRLLAKAPEVQEILSELDSRTYPKIISDEKKIDYLLWALGDK